MSQTKPEKLLQVFRPVYKDNVSGTITPLSKTVNIEPRLNSKTGEYIILWNDIKMALKTPVHVWRGDTAVPFHTDDSFEFIHPLRISTYPGIALDVLIENREIDAGINSLKIHSSPTLASVSSSPPSYRTSPDMTPARTSISLVATTNSSSEIRKRKRHPQYRGELPWDVTSTKSESKGRAPQYIPDPNDSKDDFYNHTQPIIEERDSSDVSADEFEDTQEQENTVMNDSYNRGFAYFKGENVPKDYKRAMELFLVAADLGHTEAQNQLGHMYRNGHGVKQDYHKAIEWYRKATDQGSADAQSNLASMYENGRGVTQDYSKAMELYKEAAYRGSAIAQHNLGLMYDTGRGATKDYSKAADCYEMAADQGYARAQYDLGLMYEGGRGVAQDYSRAVDLYQMAAEQGYDVAQCNLGYMYANGRGVTKDYSKALEWYTLATDKGDATAMSYLGSMYQLGNGVTQDNAKAVEWFRKAASRGNGFAQVRLKLMQEGDMV
ncbi:hypothetical protein BGX26_012884 [Mortierella sp. AD094]|nr:hypothetical protein BGX26_012884 [Mortierella sp. AD094]